MCGVLPRTEFLLSKYWFSLILIVSHPPLRFDVWISVFCGFLADSQRKGLEKRFQQQKYISKPDRKKLAERLGLKDSQVSLTNHFN